MAYHGFLVATTSIGRDPKSAKRREGQAGGGRQCGGRGEVGLAGLMLVSGRSWQDAKTDCRRPQNQCPLVSGDLSPASGPSMMSAILAGVSPQCGEWKASRQRRRVDPRRADRAGNLSPKSTFCSSQPIGWEIWWTPVYWRRFPTRPFFPPSRLKPKRATRPRGTRGWKNSPVVDVFQYMDIAPAFREQVSRYGPERVALPCGGSALVLVVSPRCVRASVQ